MRKKRVVIWGLVIAAAVIIALLIAAPLVIMDQMFNHHITYSQLFKGEDFGIDAQEHFVQTQDGLNIAIYEVKADNPKAVILTLSGIEKPSGTAFMGHAAMFQKQGYSTIMIEMRAHGNSEGDEICLGYKETLDVGAALEYVKNEEEYNNLPILIMGLSMGAGTAINSIAQFPEIDALISLSAFSSCEETFAEIMAQSMPKALASVIKPFLYVGTFIRYGSASSLKPINSIKALNGRPALLMHTTEDSNVAYSNFLRLKAAATENVEFHTFEGDEHFITPEFFNPEKDERYSTIVMDFINSTVSKSY